MTTDMVEIEKGTMGNTLSAFEKRPTFSMSYNRGYSSYGGGDSSGYGGHNSGGYGGKRKCTFSKTF
jgi:hypothetical protein